jgi:hypothetical protein
MYININARSTRFEDLAELADNKRSYRGEKFPYHTSSDVYKLGHNTWLVDKRDEDEPRFEIVYHSTAIAAIYADYITIRNGGYYSVTTKARLTRILRDNVPMCWGVSQKNWEWFVTFEGFEIDYENGMQFSTTATEAPEPSWDTEELSRWLMNDEYWYNRINGMAEDYATFSEFTEGLTEYAQNHNWGSMFNINLDNVDFVVVAEDFWGS